MSALYPQNASDKLDMDIFKNPPAEYRGTPFWSWNNKLDSRQLCSQIEIFKEMGLGGGHMHSRTGMGTEYMSEEFLDIVKTCVDKFKKEGMIGWLYDEDRWPSGFAGGLVTENEEYRARYLLFTPTPYSGTTQEVYNNSAAGGNRNEKGDLLARYTISLDKDGCLASYRLLAADEPAADKQVWYLYREIADPSSWFNNQGYADTLNPEAIKKFIEVTHERYYQAVGDEFGKTIPSIFTDEPQFRHKKLLSNPFAKDDVYLPYTDTFAQEYEKEYGADFLSTFPEIVWELADSKASISRYRYHDFVSEIFARSFADQLGDWCKAHNIMLTGHMMEESTLTSQTNAIGDAMRSYRGFQLPGIDILCDADEFTTAKQAQSAARQYGCPGVLSELYGVTGWGFDFAGHKRQGDWQAAMGVTVRVHHLSWVSMAGEAKRDYPASISYQSPWWKEYSMVEDHFARVNSVLTRGKALCKVAMVHPIESYWLCYGPSSQTASERQERDDNFNNSVEWLVKGLVDFDFIAESLLPSQDVSCAESGLCVGEMSYSTVIVPGMKTIRSSTLEKLEAFSAAGGRVIFMGEIPQLVDVQQSSRARELAAKCECIPFSRSAVLAALSAEADFSMTDLSGRQAEDFVYQMREENGTRYLFVCNTTKDRGVPAKRYNVTLKGEWQVSLLDTTSGAETPLTAQYNDNTTTLLWDAFAQGHLLLKLQNGQRVSAQALTNTIGKELGQLDSPVRVTLSEPNVLLLDQAQWRIDGGEWKSKEEILRIDNLARHALGQDERTGHIAQPWVEKPDATKWCELQLRFTLDCETSTENCCLALEQPESVQIHLDGKPLSMTDCGWWTDEAIRKVELGKLTAGEHELILTLNYNAASDLEWCYLLGDFGVRVQGRKTTITAPVRELHYGDWTNQGLPFYSGNVTYHVTCKAGRDEFCLNIPHYEGTAIIIDEGGKRLANLPFEPYRTTLKASGKHEYDITVLGSRENSFGALHWSSKLGWYGPFSWRTSADDWMYEYNLKPMGILSSPRIHAV